MSRLKSYISLTLLLTLCACFVIPAKTIARDYVITGVRLSVCLSVCLFATTITK